MIDVSRPFPFLRVEGTHYEVGFQIGKNLKDTIRRFNEMIIADMDLDEAKKRAKAFLPAFKRHCPHLLTEVEGIADGAEISLEEALLPNIRGGIRRVEGCSAYVISGEATAEGVTLIGQNQDMPPSMREVGVILNIVPEEGPEILMWTFAGLIAYHGFNDTGVAFFANSLPEPPISAPTPVDKIGPGYMIKRLMLEEASIGGILRLFDTMDAYESSFGQGNYVLADRDGILDVELFRGGHEVIDDGGKGYIAHTNHYVSERLLHLNKHIIDGMGTCDIDSKPRLKRFNDLLEEAKREISVDKLKEILGDHYNYPYSICRHFTGEGFATVASIIADPESGRMQISPGNPCEEEYYTFEMKG